MKKYIGIIKHKNESMMGLDIRILVKFSNKKSELKKWMKLYPKEEKIILDNNEMLNDFFSDFEDYT